MAGSRLHMARLSGARKLAIATFAVGALAIAAMAAVTLAKAPPRLVLIGKPGVKAIGANGAAPLARFRGDITLCQGGEVLPRGVSAIRISMWAYYGEPVQLKVFDGSRVLTDGSRSATWTSDSVTVPVMPVSHRSTNVKLCFGVGPSSEPLSLLGPSVPKGQSATVLMRDAADTSIKPGEGQLLRGRETVEYLAPGRGSWWSRALIVARHLGLGRAYSGSWIALLVAALMAAATVLAVRLALRELR